MSTLEDMADLCITRSPLYTYLDFHSTTVLAL